MDANALSRFMDKVQKDPDTGCWEWTACRDKDGYGIFTQNKNNYRAHRLIADHHGIDITDKLVRHQCDNPGCVNPDHLDVGTHMDNMNDRKIRDRQAKGSKNGTSKLTEAQVIDMRNKYQAGGVSIRQISKERSGVIFLLWGGYAKKKAKLIDRGKHHILSSGHPSPLSANRGYWFGNKHFSRANNILIDLDCSPINW